MDDREGFFPERRILAMRREQEQWLVPPPPPDKSKHAVLWFALCVTFFLSFFPVAMTMTGMTGLKDMTGTVLRPVLLIACYGLAAFAVTGVVIGSYRGLRYAKRVRT